MRAFHNAIKRYMIEYTHLTTPRVLDLSCGRGGDMTKFCYNVSDYVGVDIDEAALQEAESRLPYLPVPMTSVRFYQHDLTEPLDLGETFDIINCQFAIHYMLRDQESWDTFLSTVRRHSHSGTYLLVSCMNGDYIERRLPIVITNNRGIEKFVITRSSGGAVEVYNSLIQTAGNSQPEWLVRHGALVEDMNSIGFEVQRWSRFEDMLEEGMIDRKVRDAMKRVVREGDWTGEVSRLNEMYVFKCV